MKEEFDCSNKGNPCSTIISNGVDVCIDPNDCKIRADITVERVRNVMIWGYVTDCVNRPVSDALVKLIKYQRCGDLYELCRTYTDSCGYYQFDVEQNCEGRYKVLVSQSTHCNNSKLSENPCMETCRAINCPPEGSRQHCGSVASARSISSNNIRYR